MTQLQKLHAAELLTRRSNILGEQTLLPKIFMVNGECYWFYLPALRAAHGTPYSVEVMTIEEAWKITGRDINTLPQSDIVRGFNQRGEDYDGFLFRDHSVKLDKIAKL